MNGYKDLQVWQQAIRVVESVYHETRSWPREEQHGLSSQIRRAAVSIASNIAEGSSRQGIDFKHFLRIALGSTLEVETQIIIAARLTYTKQPNADAILAGTAELGRMLNGLMKSIERGAKK